MPVNGKDALCWGRVVLHCALSNLILSVLWYLRQNVFLLNLLPKLELTEGFFTFYLELNAMERTLYKMAISSKPTLIYPK